MTLVFVVIGIATVLAALLSLFGVFAVFFSLGREHKILRENRRDAETVTLDPKQWRRWLNRRYATAWCLMMAFAWGNLAFALSTWLFDFGIETWARGYMTVFAGAIVVAFLTLGQRHNQLVYVLRDPGANYTMRSSRRSSRSPAGDPHASLDWKPSQDQHPEDYRRDD